ncbi:galactokinase [Kroppenstedtia eburnea]|uniref:Galactokinase n=1 Tax=Kroppenstedtia eburnea TaxID=714067 RepID=A0A1N7J322_9BACL|nr:galactokinase [Kroppenstedtia eburnea]EGK13289.1 galactokinase [Desmospora sp. 8437]QKI82459.1 galactokinase [Kroppenstedtia eburnea]SIS43699.1 galactokinase [Kroppenstedtia eburnea]
MRGGEAAREAFKGVYGPGEVRLFFAPGRVNLIGEHTDYTGGYVFPAALTLGTWAALRPRKDGVFRLASTRFAERAEFRADEVRERREEGWTNFPKGMIRELADSGAGLPGADILYHGDLPPGAGLSSSASIGLVTGVALAALEDRRWRMLDLIQMVRRSENRYIGVQCGIMDPFASGMGKAGHAILLHCRRLDYRHVPLKLGDYRLMIIHTNKVRELAESRYNQRRRECEEGFRQLRQRLPEATDLGSVGEEAWLEAREAVESPLLRRRLAHVVTENARVLRSEQALVAGDLHRFGELMKESHRSLRENYEVTGRELDTLFEAAIQVPGCIGARMTGAGFGGCTVNLVHREALETFRRRVGEQYIAETGREPVFHETAIGDGAREIGEEEQAWQCW